MNKLLFICLSMCGLLFSNCGGLDGNYRDRDIDQPVPDPNTPTSHIPELLYGNWEGANSIDQTLILILNKDGSCSYQRENRAIEKGVFSYIPDEKKIVTTMTDGSSPIIYFIEMLTETDLVVQTTKELHYNFKRFHTYDIGDIIELSGTPGIVIEINETGRSGIALSLTESEPIDWCTKEEYNDYIKERYSYYNITHITLRDVMWRRDGWYNKYPAYAWISELGPGWDMPMTETISIINKNEAYLNEVIIKNGGTPISSYWTGSCKGTDGVGAWWNSGLRYTYDFRPPYSDNPSVCTRGINNFSN